MMEAFTFFFPSRTTLLTLSHKLNSFSSSASTFFSWDTSSSRPLKVKQLGKMSWAFLELQSSCTKKENCIFKCQTKNTFNPQEHHNFWGDITVLTLSVKNVILIVFSGFQCIQYELVTIYIIALLQLPGMSLPSIAYVCALNSVIKGNQRLPTLLNNISSRNKYSYVITNQ